ncbi:MAG: hypothetical protein LBV22_00200 [Mycoplasmataceae bacterium]|jgi:hypothetical protein|nr:hypothetical protein [Mycoplasmataceae bacterium]
MLGEETKLNKFIVWTAVTLIPKHIKINALCFGVISLAISIAQVAIELWWGEIMKNKISSLNV